MFKITLAGELTTLYNFCEQPSCSDGDNPSGALVQGANNEYYGAVGGGGASLYGGIFKLTSTGKLSIIYSFCPLPTKCTDGIGPVGIVAGPDGNFYGATRFGGAAANKGTLFKITSSGELTALHRFCTDPGGDGACPDGAYPYAAPALGSDGYYFGMTEGWNGPSSIYAVTPSRQFKVLYAWRSGGGGSAGMVQGTDGLFYGTTLDDGANSLGTVFSFDVRLGSFVKAEPSGGHVGTGVEVMGTNLAGATSVTFDGTPATFTVVSPSEITTSVPINAMTGRIKVTLPGSTLTSNLPFVIQ